MAPGNRGCAMSRVAVVAHSGKSLGGGLRELREVLAREGVTDPLWHEVTKSRKAPKHARRALEEGAEVIFVWGATGWSSAVSMRWLGRRLSWPFSRPARPTSWRRTCEFRATSSRRSGSGYMGNAA